MNLHDICRPTQWKTISTKMLTETGYPVYGANGKIGYYSEYNHAAPTILITCRGATCGTVNISEPKSYVTGNAMSLDDLDTERVDFGYLFWFLRNRSMHDVISGTAQPQITREGLKQIAVPLPSLAEQRRIAAVLDKADELRHKRRQALARLDQLTQSVFLDMFGDPVTNPKGWKQAVLGDIATFIGGGTPSRACPEYFTGSICWATSKDMKCDFLVDTEEHITEQAIKNSATNLVPEGTILVVVKSKILMHHLPVAITRVPTCFGQDLKGILLSEPSDRTYAVTALRKGKSWLLKRARGVNTEGLTLDHLRAFPIPMPPVSLRRKFAESFEKVERLKESHRTAKAESDHLFSSLQQRAFRGELFH